jgi:DNA polymerase V
MGIFLLDIVADINTCFQSVKAEKTKPNTRFCKSSSIVVATIHPEFHILRHKTLPSVHLENIDRAEQKFTMDEYFEDYGVFGVVTWILNDARS